jgi:hypothetical protein
MGKSMKAMELGGAEKVIDEIPISLIFRLQTNASDVNPMSKFECKGLLISTVHRLKDSLTRRVVRKRGNYPETGF